METTTINQFIYLVYYEVNAKRQKFLVKNHTKVNYNTLVLMASEKIGTEIDNIYKIQQGLNVTESAFKKRLRKNSSFTIEDLNEIQVYRLGLNFNTNEQPENEEIPEPNETRSEFRLNQ